MRHLGFFAPDIVAVNEFPGPAGGVVILGDEGVAVRMTRRAFGGGVAGIFGARGGALCCVAILLIDEILGALTRSVAGCGVIASGGRRTVDWLGVSGAGAV